MTPSAIAPSHTDRDRRFSELLWLHAQSLELTELCEPGPWERGQGARRVRGTSFFWDLSSLLSCPMGLHHPLTLDEHAVPPITPAAFTGELEKRFPDLAGWRWTVLPTTHPWTDSTWSDVSAWDLRARGSQLRETDATLKADSGWCGFERLRELTRWCVRLDADAFWCASREPLPAFDPSLPWHRYAWLRAFLSGDCLGAGGRFDELSRELRRAFPQLSFSGLNGRLATPARPAHVKFDDISSTEIGLAFPLALLSEDIAGVARDINSL